MSSDRPSIPADAARDGSAAEILPQVYDELMKLAQHRMNGERPGHTLGATALVNEAYLRLVGKGDPGWAGKAHFFKAAAEAMQRILIDHARRRARKKRGGGFRRARLTTAEIPDDGNAQEILDLDEAISRLGERDPEAAQVVRLRFYAGLTNEEAAEILGVSLSTVKRDWTVARAWLYRQLTVEP